jgi:hypothetical protein
MRRRDFIKVIAGSVAAWPVAARAQQSAKIPRIGIIDPAARWDPFRQGLRDLGYIEGRDIAIEYRSAETRPERLVAAAIELARLPVDVMVTFGSPATQAAKQATTIIPIVMIGIGDPVRAGFVASLAHPGGNITGNTILGPEVAPKRLQLLKLAVPTMSRVAFLWNPDNPSHAAYLDEWKAAAPALGAEMLFVAVRSSDEFDSAFAAELPPIRRVAKDAVRSPILHQAVLLAREVVRTGGVRGTGAGVEREAAEAPIELGEQVARCRPLVLSTAKKRGRKHPSHHHCHLLRNQASASSTTPPTTTTIRSESVMRARLSRFYRSFQRSPH